MRKVKMCAYLTWQCPRDCSFCQLKKHSQKTGYSEVMVDEWKEAIEAVDPSFVILFGGEPTSYIGWKHLCKWLTERGTDFTLFSTLAGSKYPLTVSADSFDKRSLNGLEIAQAFKGTVVNVQINKENCSWAEHFIKLLDGWGIQWLADLNHSGLRKNNQPYLLRTPSEKQRLSYQEVTEVESWLIRAGSLKTSLEPPFVYRAVINAVYEGWKCRPEESVGYLTVAPDTSLLCCVDLPLTEKIYAKEWPECYDRYVKSRVEARDKWCNSCWWRHEISASLGWTDEWDKKSMLKEKENAKQSS